MHMFFNNAQENEELASLHAAPRLLRIALLVLDHALDLRQIAGLHVAFAQQMRHQFRRVAAKQVFGQLRDHRAADLVLALQRAQSGWLWAVGRLNRFSVLSRHRDVSIRISGTPGFAGLGSLWRAGRRSGTEAARKAAGVGKDACASGKCRRR